MTQRKLPPWKTAAWRSRLVAWVLGLLAFETLTGLAIWLLPFSVANQYAVLVHVAVGLVFLVPFAWFQAKHLWYNRRAPVLRHVTLTGYFSMAATLIAVVSGLVLTAQGLFGRAIGAWWDFAHIASTLAVVGSVVAHLVIDVRRFRGASPAARGSGGASDGGLRTAVGATVLRAGSIAVVLAATIGLLAALHAPADPAAGTTSTAYGEEGATGDPAPTPAAVEDAEAERAPYGAGAGHDFDGSPFEPSLARTRSGETVDPGLLGGSASCGSGGCHEQIWREWQPGAHRYAAMDTSFQAVQRLFAEERGRRATKYCAGCHDPISLLAGTKVSEGEPLTHPIGRDEGVSCLACHAMTQADVRGNADFVGVVPERYLFWAEEGGVRERLHHFLLRTYPDYHRETLQPTFLKTPEFCGTCHKQFVPPRVNGVGWVGLQNQYDDWRKSRWNHPGDPGRTVQCRECHMPLAPSTDPAAGDVLDYNRTADDGRHRSHRFLGANQYLPLIHDLPGGEEHVELTERWLRGDMEISEIADKWRSGDAVPVELDLPGRVRPGDSTRIGVTVTNHKPGHHFPTGPLDFIESWVHLRVTDPAGRVVFESGALDDREAVSEDAIVFRGEPVDRSGRHLVRHELWRMVGVRWARSVFPGFSDRETFGFRVPTSLDGDALRVEAELLYRKFGPNFLEFLQGDGQEMRAPITVISRAEGTIGIDAATSTRRATGRDGSRGGR
jgi:hypothetical protein